MDATQVSMPQTEKKKRLGLFPVRIGSSVMHRVGIAMPIDPPMYDAGQYTTASKSSARTRVRQQKPRYEMGTIQQGARSVTVPIKALPGCPVYLEVQPWDQLSVEEREQVKWTCNHADCAGKRWDTVDELRADHDDPRVLQEEAEKAPDGRPHMYFGVIEIAGVEGKPEERDATGKVIKRAVEGKPPTIMIVSNEE